MEYSNLILQAFYEGDRKECVDFLNKIFDDSEDYCPPWRPLLQRTVHVGEPDEEEINEIYKQEALRCAISQELKQKYTIYIELKYKKDMKTGIEKKNTRKCLDDLHTIKKARITPI